MQTVDLHGLNPTQALRRLEMELHSARQVRAESILIVTGRGLGNRAQVPILRTKVEEWLRSPTARALGVKHQRRVSKGGALEVDLSW